MSITSTTERFINQQEAAAILGIQPSTLEKWRNTGEGPGYYKVGRCRRYKLSELLTWVETTRREGSKAA